MFVLSAALGPGTPDVADTDDHGHREQGASRNGPGDGSLVAEKALREQRLPAGGRPAAKAGQPEQTPEGDRGSRADRAARIALGARINGRPMRKIDA